MSPQIGIVDYGMGNRRSVEKAPAHVGARPLLSSDPRSLSAAAGLVVPGVGAFPRAMENLRSLGLAELIRERAGEGTPMLGICLGMQLAFDSSEELGGAEGLGIVPGTVTALQSGGLKLPHIRWAGGAFSQPAPPLADGLPGRGGLYPGHSHPPP